MPSKIINGRQKKTAREGRQTMAKFNLQELMLGALRREKQSATIFLMNGFQLKGTVTGYDDFTVFVESDGKQQMIYKHAISTIIPAKSIMFTDNT